MRKILAAVTLTAFAFAPAIGVACEYGDAAMASAEPPAQLGSAPAPAASKAPAPAVVAKASARKAVKEPAEKASKPSVETKVAANRD